MANNKPRVDPKVKRLINEQCDITGIDYYQGDEIWVLLGQFVKHVMKMGDYHQGSEGFKSVYIKDLGTIYPDKKVVYSQKKTAERVAYYRMKKLLEQEEREKNGIIE